MGGRETQRAAVMPRLDGGGVCLRLHSHDLLLAAPATHPTSIIYIYMYIYIYIYICHIIF